MKTLAAFIFSVGFQCTQAVDNTTLRGASEGTGIYIGTALNQKIFSNGGIPYA